MSNWIDWDDPRFTEQIVVTAFIIDTRLTTEQQAMPENQMFSASLTLDISFNYVSSVFYRRGSHWEEVP